MAEPQNIKHIIKVLRDELALQTRHWKLLESQQHSERVGLSRVLAGPLCGGGTLCRQRLRGQLRSQPGRTCRQPAAFGPPGLDASD